MLERAVDVTGLSGNAVVAEGVVFTDDTAVVRWLPVGTVRPTTVIHESAESVISLHGQGITRITWLDY